MATEDKKKDLAASQPEAVVHRVIARRVLRDESAGSSVELLVYEPVQDPNDENGDWSCRFEITENNLSLTSSVAHGVDSLQSLLTALSGLRRTLKQEESRLSWLRGPGQVGMPIMVTEDDRDLAALLEHLIEAEYCRQVLATKLSRK